MKTKTCVITKSSKRVCGRPSPTKRAVRASGELVPNSELDRAIVIHGRDGLYLLVGRSVDLQKFIGLHATHFGFDKNARPEISSSPDSAMRKHPQNSLRRWNVDRGGVTGRDMGNIRVGDPGRPGGNDYVYQLGWVCLSSSRDCTLALVHGRRSDVDLAQVLLLADIGFKPSELIDGPYPVALARARAAKALNPLRMEIIVGPDGDLNVFRLGSHAR